MGAVPGRGVHCDRRLGSYSPAAPASIARAQNDFHFVAGSSSRVAVTGK